MRDFRVVDKGDGTYINISQLQSVNEKIKKITGMSNLDALYLTKTEIDNLFKNCMLIETWVLGFGEKRRKSGTTDKDLWKMKYQSRMKEPDDHWRIE